MFSSSSHAELLALLRAIVEAKFHKDPDDLDVPGSAILARVAVRIRDEIVAEEVRREGGVAEARWREWIDLGPERREWEGAKDYATVAWRDAWAKWSADERRVAAKHLLSPFEPGEAGLLRFLAEVEVALGRQ
ncbi:hypothetical protein WMF26_45300 [Sorangium sp. So ce185]|uniref:hypothetical protein n=1 Tax=Sorangium sp. So ce185 TaxID=3133287 RepID=UPI003F5FDF67